MTTVTDLKTQLASGKLSRRRFMEGAAALGVSLAAAQAMMGEALAAPQKGGTFRQGLTGGGSGDSLDPAQILDSYMINVSAGQMRNNLTEIGPDGNVRAELATSWEASGDAATWTFEIRKGVEFHNGKTLAPNDVVESFRHHMGEGTKSAAKGLVQQITEVKADGDKVVFALQAGNADFPFLVSDYHLNICPAKDGGGIDWESGVGTGGYALETFEPGVRTNLKRHANYWKPDAAYFDSVENLFIADVAARTSALRTGEIESMSNIDLKTAGLMERDKNLKVFSTYGNKHTTFPMDTRVAPFDNNDVRLALKYALNRQELLDKVVKGYGELASDHPIGPANIYRATPEEIPQRAFDPDKAKFHLKQAGHDSLDVAFHTADTAFEGAIDAATLYAESAKAAGINIQIVREPDDGYWSNVWLVKPWVASYWGGRPTEDWMFSQVYSSGADWNEAHWEHERFNKLLLEARSQLDAGKRREIYVEMQRIVSDEGGSVIPVFMAYTHGVSSKIGLPKQLANNWELDGHKNAERWWFV